MSGKGCWVYVCLHWLFYSVQSQICVSFPCIVPRITPPHPALEIHVCGVICAHSCGQRLHLDLTTPWLLWQDLCRHHRSADCHMTDLLSHDCHMIGSALCSCSMTGCVVACVKVTWISHDYHMTPFQAVCICSHRLVSSTSGGGGPHRTAAAQTGGEGTQTGD